MLPAPPRARMSSLSVCLCVWTRLLCLVGLAQLRLLPHIMYACGASCIAVGQLVRPAYSHTVRVLSVPHTNTHAPLNPPPHEAVTNLKGLGSRPSRVYLGVM